MPLPAIANKIHVRDNEFEVNGEGIPILIVSAYWTDATGSFGGRRDIEIEGTETANALNNIIVDAAISIGAEAGYTFTRTQVLYKQWSRG